eukprot:15435471-Alexandrium_andersonii.AAC.1
MSACVRSKHLEKSREAAKGGGPSHRRPLPTGQRGTRHRNSRRSPPGSHGDRRQCRPRGPGRGGWTRS